eukprot:CAMPEP_0116144742 /NCGR_PEP_ID=MMETSP0329-20121206/16181_1 /TAXON_ID=697910 /ORGANISM="Pseudo-nitzschia arenysensis, Strain B593" /LENGTH=235 /DNA_ID=CAMNT_0003640219 /DNA_START=372 /DNA_END=1079 /DNA_ORIENTATION=-
MRVELLTRAKAKGSKKNQPKRAQSQRPAPKNVKRIEKSASPKKAASKKAKKVDKGDTVETILLKLAEMEQIGILEVKEEFILKATGYARHDSTGYRKASKKIQKELVYAIRSTKDKQTTWKLTEAGRGHLIERGIIVIPEVPKSNEEYHAQLMETLKKIVKGPPEKLETVFRILSDGDWHPVPDLLTETGYKRTDSTGYRSIMAGMRKLDLLEKKGKMLRFSEKAFMFGRPQDEE